MHLSSLPDSDVLLDVELCRAMFEKNPEKLLELVSDWLQSNQLELSDDFQVPAYLNAILSGVDTGPRREVRRAVRVLQS